MNSYTQRSTALEHNRNRLEALIAQSDYTTVYHPVHLGKFLSRMGRGLVHWLTAGSEPRVSHEVGRNADSWKVFDPASKRTLRFDHEESVRIWLESRYYR
ncbi:hypothetical protein PN498_15090 [Oscillatoria sp. CS-180]|uniref:hypothetical protein n=1 Tax=Oscillatoria sp. CS-180 TaxID=3021720 RepID=UPI00232F632E|nr:hypothetical protein [Oscillatoria sp. CS-180]MDB9527324.1 hypothetical protein [Oscillatoria sp. CS-180]